MNITNFSVLQAMIGLQLSKSKANEVLTDVLVAFGLKEDKNNPRPAKLYNLDSGTEAKVFDLQGKALASKTRLTKAIFDVGTSFDKYQMGDLELKDSVITYKELAKAKQDYEVHSEKFLGVFQRGVQKGFDMSKFNSAASEVATPPSVGDRRYTELVNISENVSKKVNEYVADKLDGPTL